MGEWEPIMTDIDLIANKVADILMKRFEEKEAALAERVMELYWEIPIKTYSEYAAELELGAGRRLPKILKEK